MAKKEEEKIYDFMKKRYANCLIVGTSKDNEERAESLVMGDCDGLVLSMTSTALDTSNQAMSITLKRLILESAALILENDEDSLQNFEKLLSIMKETKSVPAPPKYEIDGNVIKAAFKHTKK